MNHHNDSAQPDFLLEGSSATYILHNLCKALPTLPSVLRYYDEFDDCVHSIKNPNELIAFEINSYGTKNRVDFSHFSLEFAYILKHVFAFILAQDLTVMSALSSLSGARHFTTGDVISLVEAGPAKIAHVWTVLRGKSFPAGSYTCAKHILQLLCALRLHGWSSDYHEYLRNALPVPAIDKYASVRSGDVFLTADEEAVLVRYIDDTVNTITSLECDVRTHDELTDTAMMMCSYQFGMRRSQIAMLTIGGVEIWPDDDPATSSVHLTFHMAKQRSNSKRKSLKRVVKGEWAPLFQFLKKYRASGDVDITSRFFSITSTAEVGERISALVRRLTGSNERGTVTDLRHTAAQRLVDAGASHEELAEFLGHAQLNTGLIYFAASASHAEKVNKALGASEIYRRVAKIAHDRFISLEELSKLKGDKQIAGVPHGIPISGIGGCESGQPTCPYNPITSCYGCRKFMPVNNQALHRQVLSDMRNVVLFFERSSRGDLNSPAYLQLQRTIAEIQSVIVELNGGKN